MAVVTSRMSALVLCALIAVASHAQGSARAQARLPLQLPEESFSGLRDGGAIYARICAGCHLPDGKGAVGAGRYPALAGNSKLEHVEYPIAIVLDGHGAMPPFKGILDDEQIAAVLNYARGPGLSNNFAASITTDEVHRARR